jgi:hypothetical protein
MGMTDKIELKEKDLIAILDIAVDNMRVLSTRSLYQLDSKLAQTYAFTSAVVLYLNSKSLLKQEVVVDENISAKYIKD